MIRLSSVLFVRPDTEMNNVGASQVNLVRKVGSEYYVDKRRKKVKVLGWQSATLNVV